MRAFFGVCAAAFKGRRRTLLTWLVVVSIALSTSTINSLAQEEVYAYTAVKGVITCKSGLVRESASTASTCVFCVSNNEEVIVLNETTGKDGKTWYQISVGDSVGYIRSDLVKKTSTNVTALPDSVKAAAEGVSTDSSDSSKKNEKGEKTENSGVTTTVQMGKIKGSNVRLRSDAGTDSQVTGVLSDGASVIVSGSTDKDGKKWYKVQCVYEDKLYSGYVYGDYVTDIKEQTVQSGTATGGSTKVEGEKTSASSAVGTVKAYGVNVRKSPVDGDVICRLTKGNTVAAIDRETGSDDQVWYKITFTNEMKAETGYIRSDFVDGVVFEEKSPEPEKKEESSSETTYTSGSLSSGAVKGINVNVRKEPVSGEVIGRLSTGHSVYIKGSEDGSDGKGWYKITFVYNNNNEEGYIRSDYVTVEQVLKEEKTEEKTDDSNDSDKESGAKTGSIKGYGVRIRETAVNGSVMAQLDSGHPLEIAGETDGSDGFKWYKVNYSYQGNAGSGYIRSDFVNVITTASATAELSDEEFEETISVLPSGYKNSLRLLHEKYPHWRFVPVNTNLDWNEAVAKESSVGKNLVSKSSVSSWKSSEPQAYNWTDNSWYGFDGGSWASASKELIMYYMDPRNFLDESGIFQFETLDYEDYQNEAGVENILASSFMSGSYTDSDGATRSYASTFVEAGKEAGISPYHLAARCLQEQGTSGLSQSVSGNVAGYENLFNFFNIGAYAANGVSATINGLKYASGSDDSNLRPWNTRYKSIMGSAKHVSEKYVKKGQNTLYFQKFNVVNSENGIYSHQYMTNVLAASSEAARMRTAYTELDTSLVFKIPYYSNMPEELCQKPTSDSNPNNYISSLWVENQGISPEFSPVVDTYYLIVDNSVDTINIGASPVADTSSIGGAGERHLEVGTNTLQVVCKAQNGNAKTYTLIVQRNE